MRDANSSARTLDRQRAHPSRRDDERHQLRVGDEILEHRLAGSERCLDVANARKRAACQRRHSPIGDLRALHEQFIVAARIGQLSRQEVGFAFRETASPRRPGVSRAQALHELIDPTQELLGGGKILRRVIAARGVPRRRQVLEQCPAPRGVGDPKRFRDVAAPQQNHHQVAVHPGAFGRERRSQGARREMATHLLDRANRLMPRSGGIVEPAKRGVRPRLERRRLPLSSSDRLG